jgi:hypothetical protein
MVRELNLAPPEWRAVHPIHRKVRLGVVADQTEVDLTVNQIVFLQSTANSTTTVVPWAYAVRMKKITIWFMTNALGTNKSATVEWNAGATGFLLDGVSVAATSSSTTEYSILTTRPPTESLGGWFQAVLSGGTNVLFSYSAPAGAIIEVSYDWVPNWSEVSTGSLSATAAVSGVNYARAWSSNVLALPPLNSVLP